MKNRFKKPKTEREMLKAFFYKLFFWEILALSLPY